MLRIIEQTLPMILYICYFKPIIMSFIADLHIHGRYSRGCSKQLDFENLEKFARIKGLDLLGTGDFSHPRWMESIKSTLKEDDTGLLRTKNNFPFVLQNEYSFIYSQNKIGRRVHLCVMAPGLEVAEQINEEMEKLGRLDYDGRPIFGIGCPEFTERMMNISRDIEIFPAHIWTPWFSMFGSKSGFNSVKECFQEKLKYIHAIETGLSSDPAMNWRLSQLDKFSILSFSDCHSYWPWRLGREATVFNARLGYKNLIKSIRNEKIKETIEVDPAYGKYHENGHRKCGVRLSPKESLKNKNLCPVCKKPLTVGVMQRVEELADRPKRYNPPKRPGFRKLLPLHEIISYILNKGISSKTVWQEYNKLIKGKSENEVLLETPEEELLKNTSAKIADSIIKNREGKVYIQPGYDGVYGVAYFEKQPKEKIAPKKAFQKGIFDFY